VTDAGSRPRHPFTRRWPTLTGASAILGCSACASLGPRAVRWERTSYNFAIQATQDAQLLLNLVRLKYRDTPVFLELSSITSLYALEGAADAGTEFQKDTDLWKLGVSAKSTFALLTQLVALQSGEVTRLTPILTLPVGR